MAQSGVATAERPGGGGRSRDGDAPVPDPSMIDLGIREVPGGLLSPFLVRLGAAPGAIWTEKYD
ncbi:MAG: hypothetical protein M0005_15050 [Actinomycetota bacterium]|nr:hypothetical protein [Actinomycetota bacterium]